MTCVAAVPGAPEIVLLCLVVSRSLPSKHKKLFCLVFLKLWVAGGLCPLLEFQTWSWFVKNRDCQKRGCQSRSFKEVKVSWQMTALVHPTLSPLERCDMWRWRAHELVRLVSAWQWQMGLMAQRAQSACRGAPGLLLSINTRTAHRQLPKLCFIYLFVWRSFFFWRSHVAGLSLSTVLGWMLSAQMGKGNWKEREWSTKNDWELRGERIWWLLVV